MKIALEHKPSAAELAAEFAAMGDEAQADFFEAVARAFASWEKPGAGDTQLWFIARHMKKCACISEAGREWVRGLAQYIGPEGEATHGDG